MAEIKIYAFIGTKRNAYDSTEYISGTEVSDALAQAEAGTDADIKVSVNSGGGSVTDGYKIISALQKCTKPVTAVIDGYAASMGYYLCLGATKITAAKNSIIMLHSVQGSAVGSPEDLIAEAEVLKKFNATIATMLAARTGLTEAEVTEKYLGKAVYLTAQEALHAKLIDAIEEYAAENIPAVTASMSFEEAEMKWAAMIQKKETDTLLQRVVAAVKEKFGLAEKKAALSDAEENGLLCVLSGVKWATDDAESFLKNNQAVSPEVKSILEKVSKANTAFVVEIVNKVYGQEITDPAAIATHAQKFIAKTNDKRTAEATEKAASAALEIVAHKLKEKDDALAAATQKITALETENKKLASEPGDKNRKPIVAIDGEPKQALTKEELNARFDSTQTD